MGRAQGYDRLSASYQGLEWLVFGNQLQRARMALVDRLPAWQRLLILGDGDGRLLEQLYVYRRGCAESLEPHRSAAASQRAWSITSIDFSAAMLQRQQSRLAARVGQEPSEEANEGDIRFKQLDALSYMPEPGAFDVLITPFFLDCFSRAELTQALPLWLSGLREDGVYLQVDFRVPESPWQRPRARLLLWAMHAFFAWQTGLANRRLVDSQAVIKQCGMRLAAEQISGQGMIVAQLWRRAAS